MQKRSLLLALGAFAVRPANALYDPRPIGMLEAATGAWTGTLTYRDYQRPDRMVTLKTSMSASLTAPDELALYYVFDDGPGKTVYSYERMTFDLAGSRIIWNTGSSKPGRDEYKITSASVQEGKTALAFEKIQDASSEKYAFELTPKTWLLTKYEAAAGKEAMLRNKYEFARLGA